MITQDNSIHALQTVTIFQISTFLFLQYLSQFVDNAELTMASFPESFITIDFGSFLQVKMS